MTTHGFEKTKNQQKKTQTPHTTRGIPWSISSSAQLGAHRGRLRATAIKRNHTPGRRARASYTLAPKRSRRARQDDVDDDDDDDSSAHIGVYKGDIQAAFLPSFFVARK